MLVNIAKELWHWCLQRRTALKAQHLPGKENLNADFMSHHLRDRTNWVLNLSLYRCGVLCNWISLQRDFSSIAKIFQLVSRPRSGGYRRILSGLGELGLCPPAMVPHYFSPGKDPCPQSDVGSGNTMLANTTMVSSIDGNAGGLSTHSSRSNPIPSGHTFPQLRLPSLVTPTSVGRMKGLRRQLQAEEISEGAINLILASWRKKTNVSYNSAWRKWGRWCMDHNTDPFSASIASILEFLTQEFKAGLRIHNSPQLFIAVVKPHKPLLSCSIARWIKEVLRKSGIDVS